MKQIYLDYHATTPIADKVRDAMLEWMGESQFGNAHAMHQFGHKASDALECARGELAKTLNCSRHALIFTSGATEAANMALLGVMNHLKQKKRTKIITVKGEHPAVANVLQALADKSKAEIIYAPIESDGRVIISALQKLMEDANVGLVAIMHSHNEIGVIQDVKEICRLAHEKDILVFSDMTQSLGKIPLNLRDMAVDMACFSAHKLYGPMGIGALYCKNTKILQPIYHGGGQEKQLRSGTVPVFLAVGFGKAALLAEELLPDEMLRVKKLRDELCSGLQNLFPDMQVNGNMEHRLSGNLHLTFPMFSHEKLRDALPEIQFSSGSACSSADKVTSNIVQALDEAKSETHIDKTNYGYMRLCVGRNTDADEITQCLALFASQLG